MPASSSVIAVWLIFTPNDLFFICKLKDRMSYRHVSRILPAMNK
ncbi:hypothetical protein PPEP_a3577 [Pseudoalteromonas peptidolytica F12-50-A1]|uniref:Uncharacterized protein n=1 Tax=Pseudoalteromonas peptidolytica F12-50-A1 TaxID=1315280 RepID=A0A8I0MVR3_9GAMM|nr:hypothetical protein [Pseudoalteromonas peptidolytica F12-50-A1]